MRLVGKEDPSQAGWHVDQKETKEQTQGGDPKILVAPSEELSFGSEIREACVWDQNYCPPPQDHQEKYEMPT